MVPGIVDLYTPPYKHQLHAIINKLLLARIACSIEHQLHAIINKLLLARIACSIEHDIEHDLTINYYY